MTGRFRLSRVLVVGPSLESVVADVRVVALVRSLGARTVTLTLAAAAMPDDAARAFTVALGRRGVPAAAWDHLEVRCARLDGATAGDGLVAVGSLLAAHDTLIACGAPPDPALIVAGWQHGLCVVNAIDQAERAAVFEDDYVDEPAMPDPARSGSPPVTAGGVSPSTTAGVASPSARSRWYSMMEGAPVVMTAPQHVVLEYGARINPRAVVHNECEIRIGRGSLLGADAELNLYTARFTMGQFCHTSSYLAVIGSRHTLHRPSTFSVSRGPFAFLGEPADTVGDVVIGNDVWIGTRVVVLPGVQIADGCVVGAGSVVTSSLTEPYGIYAGNPARLIRFRFPPHVVKWLEQVQWWDWPARQLAEARELFRTDLSSKSEAELWALLPDERQP